MKKTSLWSLLKKVHADEEGSVSLETVLIIGAIALPVIIFLLYVGWPRIKTFFNNEMNKMESGTTAAEGQ
jgi:Flp pilus assembly pilin Flp